MPGFRGGSWAGRVRLAGGAGEKAEQTGVLHAKAARPHCRLTLQVPGDAERHGECNSCYFVTVCTCLLAQKTEKKIRALSPVRVSTAQRWTTHWLTIESPTEASSLTASAVALISHNATSARFCWSLRSYPLLRFWTMVLKQLTHPCLKAVVIDCSAMCKSCSSWMLFSVSGVYIGYLFKSGHSNL